MDDRLSAFSKTELRPTIPFELPPVSLGSEGILMRLPVKYPELVSVFIEASRNLKSIFRDIEDAK